jgi:hypothetical protein
MPNRTRFNYFNKKLFYLAQTAWKRVVYSPDIL